VLPDLFLLKSTTLLLSSIHAMFPNIGPGSKGVHIVLFALAVTHLTQLKTFMTLSNKRCGTPLDLGTNTGKHYCKGYSPLYRKEVLNSSSRIRMTGPQARVDVGGS
jgi:hypothetical protein